MFLTVPTALGLAGFLFTQLPVFQERIQEAAETKTS